jgi:SAM-dependent methyltransferase
MTTDTPSRILYLFDNANTEAARQLPLLAAMFDPHTINVLDGLDLDYGAPALDLGAGAGTIASYLAHGCELRRVVALDANARHIKPDDRIEIREANVLDADLGEGVYGLIHARLLFMHLPDREELLQRAVAALKPGGILVISDWDCTRPGDMLLTASPRLRDAFHAFQYALIAGGKAVGMDPGWAHRLPAAMLTAGLTEVDAQIDNRFWTGGQPGMQLHASNSRQLETKLLAVGINREQLQTLRDGMQDPEVNGYSYDMVTAVGRRPDQ